MLKMITRQDIKNEISQIIALTERNLKLSIRFKVKLIFSFISPIISLILPLIIMEKFFEFNADFGPWDKTNYIIYIGLAYIIMLLQGIKSSYPSQFHTEKYWQTLPALIIAPFNRITLLLGIFLSYLVIVLPPITIFIIICYVFYPISLFTIIFIIAILFLITLIFSGVGIILGVLAISKENRSPIINYVIGLLFLTACLTFPFEIFPKPIQTVVNLNPLYHIFFFVRIAWIEDNIIVSITSHLFSFLLLTVSAIILPFIGTIIFNKIYKKYGIVGY